mmetsp:Transcript_3921/g.6153  ORF Transcript_3921/g.6153 Transcript_3921/m.6153 type:complete len:310 (-) Transcript_3921:19-948(-)
MLGIGRELQAFRVDNALKETIRSRVSDIVNDVSIGSYQRYQPELDMTVDIVYHALSTASQQPTPGMRIFGVDYSSQGNAMWLFSCIFLKWAFNRVEKFALLRNWRRSESNSIKYKMWKLLSACRTCIKVLILVNHLTLIGMRGSSSKGASPDISRRVSGYRWAARVESEQRVSSASPAQIQLINRRILWSSIEGLLAVLAVAIDWRELTSTLRHLSIDMYHRSRRAAQEKLPPALRADIERFLSFIWPQQTSSSDHCAICGMSEVEAPHVGECGHICCYYCLEKAVKIDRFRCPRCGARLTECNRYIYD